MRPSYCNTQSCSCAGAAGETCLGKAESLGVGLAFPVPIMDHCLQVATPLPALLFERACRMATALDHTTADISDLQALC